MPRLLTKRFWERLAIGLAILVAVALMVDVYFASRAAWRLRSRLTAIRAAGDPASIADLEPAPIPDDQNAAAIIEHVRPRLDQFSKEYGRFFNSPIGKKYDASRDRGEPATKEQIEAIRAILSHYPDVELAISQAAACNQYASLMDFSLDHRAFIDQITEYVQTGRTATRFLGWRNEVLLADGDRDAAVKNAIEALRLARLHQNEPTMVASLVSIAMRMIASDQLYDALAAGPVSPELHAMIDSELALQDDPDQLTRTLKTERAVGADWINSQISGRYAPLGHMFGWFLKDFQTGTLDEMEECINLAARPWHEVRTEFGQEGESSQPTGHGVLADLLVPAVRASFEANARSLAVLRALRIDNALRAFADKNGHEAKGLDELNLPKGATIDPYSGQPLKLKHTDDGWIIYSVMQNGTDDGGDFIGLKDYGVAPRRYRATEKAEESKSPERDESEPVQ